MKNRKLYYFLNLTWGLPMTLIGALTALILIIAGKKPKRHGGCLYFNMGKNWGGMALGLVFLTDESDNERIKNHEFGHSIQNAMLGVFMPFFVCIPSALRYWYQKLRASMKLKNKSYDVIWFEKWASRLGSKSIAFWKPDTVHQKRLPDKRQ